MLVDLFVENAFTASFVCLAVPLVLWNVGLQAVIETGFARFLGVEGAIGIEICTLDG